MPAPIGRGKLWLALSGLLATSFLALGSDESFYGFLYSKVRLTLDNGEREEVLGPLYYHQTTPSTRAWGVPPLFSRTFNPEIDYTEFDLLYPVLTYDRFGEEYRFQIGQFFNFSGGQSSSDTNTHRFTVFPVYFQQRSPSPEGDYTAVVPFYGQLKNRFWRDEVRFVMFPLYARSRKKDMITHNYLFPIFHLRSGEGLSGWQFWPLIGRETKVATQKTNHWNEIELIAGHRKHFGLWPVYFNYQTKLGTTNPVHHLAVLPLFARERSPQRDSTSFPWPLGFVYTDDREKQFRQWGAPWPFIVFARGEGKTINRVFPLFSLGHIPTLERNSFLWPLYHHSHLRAESLDRSRTRSCFYLYSDVRERNLDADTAKRRIDLWPAFTWVRQHDGRERLQILAPLEPILPEHKSIERNYSPLWSLWRSEQDPRTGVASQSLLWNLYRRQRGPESKKCSLLFGLFQYESMAESKQWRLFYIPLGQKPRLETGATVDR